MLKDYNLSYSEYLKKIFTSYNYIWSSPISIFNSIKVRKDTALMFDEAVKLVSSYRKEFDIRNIIQCKLEHLKELSLAHDLVVFNDQFFSDLTDKLYQLYDPSIYYKFSISVVAPVSYVLKYVFIDINKFIYDFIILHRTNSNINVVCYLEAHKKHLILNMFSL